MSEVFPRDILLRLGGQTLARYGVPVWRRAPIARGGEENKETFTRADAAACATLADRDAILRTALANNLRVDWPSGLVDSAGNAIGGPLLEGSRINGWTRSEDFNDAAWTKDNVTVSSDAIASPDGLLTADKIIETVAASAQHGISRATPAMTDNTKQPPCIFAKAAERTWLRFRTANKAGVIGDSWFNLATGQFGTIAGAHVVGSAPGPQGWYRLWALFDAGTGASGPIVRIGPSTADAVISYTGDGISGIYLWGAQFETDRPFPSSYVRTVAAAVTRAADSFTVPSNGGPMDFTVLVRLARPSHAAASGALGVSPGIFSLGAGAAPRIGLYFDPVARNLISAIDTATTDATQTTPIPAGQPTICVQYKNLTTGGQTALDVGSGFTAFSSAAAAFSAFSSQVLRVGRYDDELYGVVGDLIVARGLFTRSEMLAIP